MPELQKAAAPSYMTGMMLPQAFYLEDNVFHHELKWMQRALWLAAGHESQIPNTGSYFLYEFAGACVIVIRDHEGNVRAHHNVCRHRAARLLLEPTGTVGTITCPYHSWTYELGGKLRGAPRLSSQSPGFEKSEFSLIPVHVRTNGGIIFLSFAEFAPNFEEFIEVFARELDLQKIQRSTVAHRRVWSVAANWKLLEENNMECYHCHTAHPTYLAAHPGVGLGGVAPDAVGRVDAYPLDLKQIKKQESRGFQEVDLSEHSPCFQSIFRQVIGVDVSTESIDGQPVAPLMGHSGFDGIQTIGSLSPLTTVVLNPDHAVIFSFIPRSKRQTDVDILWLVKSDARPRDDYDVSKLTRVYDVTLAEDFKLAELTQLGVESTAYRPGPLLQPEAWVAMFHRWYLKWMVKEAAPRGAFHQE